MNDDHGLPGWLFVVLFFLVILILGSLGGQANNEPYVGICNRPTVQQTC